jgi:hypothetical protein
MRIGGHVVKDLAELFPSYTFVIQDLQKVVEAAQAAWKKDGARTDKLTNVSFQTHNFFDPQPVKGADVYYMRHVIHANADREAIQLLSALVPALKPGSRVLVSEYRVPDEENVAGFASLGLKPMRYVSFFFFLSLFFFLFFPDLNRFFDGFSLTRQRQMDMMALGLCNSKERTKEEYAKLFAAASPKLALRNVYQVPDEATSCVFEAVYGD